MKKQKNKKEMIEKCEKFFNSKIGWESTILAILILASLAPVLITYFILKFGIVRPIGNLLGGKNK
tara:strand:- start:12 stop:206 length:195 start_codon:yes stop_codon:yes gene_type:complete